MTKVIEKSKTQFFTRNPLLKEECIKNSSSSAGLEIEFVKMKTVMEKLEREIELLKIINLGQKFKNRKGKWPKIKEEFVEWSLNTNFDGYSKIFKAKKGIKAIEKYQRFPFSLIKKYQGTKN